MSPLYSRNERAGPTGGPGRRADRPVQPTGRPARTYVLSQHRRAGAGAGAAGQGHADAKIVDDRHCTSTSRPLKSRVPCTSRCGDNIQYIPISFACQVVVETIQVLSSQDRSTSVDTSCSLHAQCHRPPYSVVLLLMMAQIAAAWCTAYDIYDCTDAVKTLTHAYDVRFEFEGITEKPR